MTAALQRTPNPTVKNVTDGMVKFALKDSADPFVLKLRDVICRGVYSGDYASDVLACYYWVHQNIRYIPDPETAEYVRDSQRLVEAGQGDCDDMSVLLAALLISCGKRCAFVLVAFNGSPMPSHVFVRVFTPRGPVNLDPVAGMLSERMLGTVTREWVVPVNGQGASGGAW